MDNFAAPAAPILSNGHKFGPTTLADYQVAALRYAVLAQASYRVEMSESAMSGSDEYLPGEVQPYRRGGPVSRQAMAELAGTGLIVWSGTVEVTT